jgi:transcriptional regulator with XRE-family HTH domain
MNLQELGRALKAYREQLSLRRADVARRSGISQGYIGNIEAARPRISGIPSRPTRQVLLAWTGALGMDEQATRRVLELAGHSLREVEGSGGTIAEGPAVYVLDSAFEDWAIEQDEVLVEVRQLLRLAQRTEDRTRIVAYLRMTLEMLKQHLAH